MHFKVESAKDIKQEVQSYIEAGFKSEIIERPYKIDNLSIGVAEGNGPFKQVQSCSTLGLSMYPLKNPEGFPLDFRVEIISAFWPIDNMELFHYPNILSIISYQYAKGWHRGPGFTWLDIVKQACPYLEDKPHFQIIYPPENYWGHNFEDLKVNNTNIKFYCGFPISEQELVLKNQKGTEYLLNYFDDNNIDIFNVYRSPLLS